MQSCDTPALESLDDDANTAVAAGPSKPPMSVRALRLGRGSLWASGERPGHLRIGCVTGSVWVTQAGQPADIELRPGEVCLAHPRGKVVICCLKDALLLLDDRFPARADALHRS